MLQKGNGDKEEKNLFQEGHAERDLVQIGRDYIRHIKINILSGNLMGVIVALIPLVLFFYGFKSAVDKVPEFIGRGSFPRAQTPVEVLQPSVEKLQRDSSRFTLRLTNKTSHKVKIVPSSIYISDDQGNTYRTYVFNDINMGLVQLIQPNKSIKLDYLLNTAISQSATSIDFTLENIFVDSSGSSDSKKQYSLSWTTKL